MDRLISEQAVIDAVKEWLPDIHSTKSIEDVIKELPSVEPKIVPIANIHFDQDKMREICKEVAENMVILESRKGMDLGDFAVWVAKEIFDDGWEYNKDSFAEIACRKLAKLGIVKAKGDEWELVEQQESEG